jgi:hypothetical protein
MSNEISSNPCGIDWDVARRAIALYQFEERYLPEVRRALSGERLSFDSHETLEMIRATIREICDRDRLVIPRNVRDCVVAHFLMNLMPTPTDEV